MPFIHIRTSVKLTEEQKTELKDGIFDTISIIRGKTADMLMLHIEDGCEMYYRGRKEAALIDTMVAGRADIEDFKTHGRTVTKLFSDITGMPQDSVYIKYGEMPYCGVGGELK